MTLGPKYVGDAIAAVDGAAIAVSPRRCAKVRNRNVECMKCAAACTTGCITYVDGQLVVSPERCVGCGTCATVCPTCALEARNPTDAELLAHCLASVQGAGVGVEQGAEGSEGVTGGAGAADGAQRVVRIACSQLEAALGARLGAHASVVCAGRVEESLLAELAAAGVTRVEVMCGTCSACEQRHGLDTARLVCSTAHELFAAWGVPCTVEVVHGVTAGALVAGVSEAEAQVTLSEFFATPRACEPIRIGEAAAEVGACEAEAEAAPAADEADDAALAERADETHGTGMRFYWNSGRTRHVHSNLHVMKDGTLPHFLPDRRERLLDALAQFGQPEAADIDCRLWGSVVIDGTKCSSCRMCATFCPTGAIAKFDGADGTMGVMHYPADCVKCASCQDICPEDAIILMGSTKTHFLADGTCHKYNMTPREISLRNNPHQMLETMRKNIPGDNVFER